MKAANAMTRDVVCIEPDASLIDAHQIMTEWEIRHLPVLDGQKLVGILSDRDVLLHASRELDELEVANVTVETAMTPNPMTCDLSWDVSAIGRAMIDHKIDSLPVVDQDGDLVGLVTSTDLLDLLIAREETSMRRTIPFHYEIHTSARPGSTAARGM